MTLPASFTAAAAVGLQGSLLRWVEIQGLPWAYSTQDMAGAWWSGRAAGDQFLSGVGAIQVIPEVEAQEIDPLDGLSGRISGASFVVQDQDGQPPLWLAVGNANGVSTLATALTTGATSVVLENASSFSGGGGTIYIGLETLTYTGKTSNTLTGVTRGKYRSTAQAFPIGTLVSPRPYAMKGRRIWYYLVAYAEHTAPSDTDKVLRFVGTLEDISTSEPGLYVLSSLSLQKVMDRQVLRDLRTVRDTANIGITSSDGTEPGAKAVNGLGIGSTDFYSDDVGLFSSSEQFLLQVDDEILAVQVVSGNFRIQYRGLFNTLPAPHKAGWQGKEVCGVARYNAAGSPEQQYTKFSSTPVAEHPFASDHPLSIFLSFLASTGTGLNTSGSRNYDVLPASWGVGLDISMVDLPGIEEAGNWTDDIQYGGVLTEATAFPDLVKQLLAPIGLYAIVTLGERVTVRVNRPPLPDEVSRAVDANTRLSLASASSSRGTLSANYGAQVQQVSMTYLRDLADGKYKRVHIQRYQIADQFSGGSGREIAYECPLMYPGDSKVPGAPPTMPFNVEGLLLRRADFFRNRYAVPPPLIEEPVGYAFLDVEPGDLVSLTDAQLPNPLTGLMGIDGAVCQVVGKAVDERLKVIKLKLLMTGYQGIGYRYIAPTLEIESITNSQFFVVKANAFTDPVTSGAGYTQQDLQQLKPDGTLRDVFSGFGPWSVARYDAAGARLSTNWIFDVDTSTRTLQVEDTTGFTAGDVLVGNGGPFHEETLQSAPFWDNVTVFDVGDTVLENGEVWESDGRPGSVGSDEPIWTNGPNYFDEIEEDGAGMFGGPWIWRNIGHHAPFDLGLYALAGATHRYMP